MKPSDLYLISVACEACDQPLSLYSDHVGMKLCPDCETDFERHLDEREAEAGIESCSSK